MPPDTRITVRTPSRLVNSSTLSHIAVTESGPVRSTLLMAGGDKALVEGFRLDAADEVVTDLVIDFSHEAEHLKQYTFVATQIQDHEVAGRMTIEITAVKELEEFFFGNPKSHELHISTCPFFEKTSPRTGSPSHASRRRWPAASTAAPTASPSPTPADASGYRTPGVGWRR